MKQKIYAAQEVGAQQIGCSSSRVSYQFFAPSQVEREVVEKVGLRFQEVDKDKIFQLQEVERKKEVQQMKVHALQRSVR